MQRPWGRKVIGMFKKDKGGPCAAARRGGGGSERLGREDAVGLDHGRILFFTMSEMQSLWGVLSTGDT